LKDIYAAFGWLPRLIVPQLGNMLFLSIQKEGARRAAGQTYEPCFFIGRIRLSWYWKK